MIPRGVTRPFRFFDPHPFYTKKAYGGKLLDFEDRLYSDFWMGHGALVLGHMHPSLVEAVREQLELGFHFGTCNEWEVKLAEQVATLVPSVQMITFCNSGNEANMHAVKLARAYTKREKVAKFEGHFHGVLESLYWGVSWPLDEPESAGHDPLSAKNTVVLPFQDLEAASDIIRTEQLACVITELVVGGACFPIDGQFLKGLREICSDTGTLLIFDEVITGFGLAPGEGKELFGVTPDLTTFWQGNRWRRVPSRCRRRKSRHHGNDESRQVSEEVRARGTRRHVRGEPVGYEGWIRGYQRVCERGCVCAHRKSRPEADERPTGRR